MIKLKLSNNGDMKCFSGLIHSRDILPDYSIQLVTNESSYDYELLATNEFMNTSLPLNQSIDYGCNNLSKKSGDYFLVHGGDSTSITGVYEVFKNSNAKYLFKKQILPKDQYAIPSIIGKWFFGEGPILNMSYNISDEEYSKFKLCGYNVGHNWPQLHELLNVNYNLKDHDVAAVFQTYIPKEVYDHEVRTDTLYTMHRLAAWKELEKIPNIKIIAGQLPPNQTAVALSRSKISISPYGMGELCYRDLESIQHGCIVIKPTMDNVITDPNLFIPNETYIPCKVDYSDLNEIIAKVLTNYKDYIHIAESARRRMVQVYSYHSVAMHWYNFFANLDTITQN